MNKEVDDLKMDLWLEAQHSIKLQSKLDKIEEVINNRLFTNYVCDVEIDTIKQIIKER